MSELRLILAGGVASAIVFLCLAMVVAFFINSRLLEMQGNDSLEATDGVQKATR